jgi:hypothetical protein
MFDNIIDYLIELNEEITELTEILDDIYNNDNNTILLEQDLDITKRKVNIENKISELSILFLRLPSLNARFDVLKMYYTQELLQRTEKVYMSSESE